MKNDFIFGDKVIYNNKIHVVINPTLKEKSGIGIITEEGNIQYVEKSDCSRLPRAGEIIHVMDMVTKGTFVEREFVCFIEKHNRKKARCVVETADEGEDGYCSTWEYWKLIDEKEEMIKDLVQKISKNDPETLKKMAELILAAGEKVS